MWPSIFEYSLQVRLRIVRIERHIDCADLENAKQSGKKMD